MLSFCVHVFLVYMIFISLLCVYEEELSNVQCNTQICEFCKWVLNKNCIVDLMSKVTCWYQLIIQYNTDSGCEYLAGGVYIYFYVWVSLLVPVCVQYVKACIFVLVLVSSFVYLFAFVFVRVCVCVLYDKIWNKREGNHYKKRGRVTITGRVFIQWAEVETLYQLWNLHTFYCNKLFKLIIAVSWA